MNVNGIQSTSNPYAGNSADRNAMGQQEFLQLLVAQMKNQDPINPMDGTEFASQLAQFNSVEQLIGVNSALTDLQQSQNIMSAGLTNSMAASLTGKEVKALSNEFNLQENSSLDFSFKIPKSATEVEIVIKDENGNQVFY
jgi:Flagellar hook capping protein